MAGQLILRDQQRKTDALYPREALLNLKLLGEVAPLLTRERFRSPEYGSATQQDARMLIQSAGNKPLNGATPCIKIQRLVLLSRCLDAPCDGGRQHEPNRKNTPDEQARHTP